MLAPHFVILIQWGYILGVKHTILTTCNQWSQQDPNVKLLMSYTTIFFSYLRLQIIDEKYLLHYIIYLTKVEYGTLSRCWLNIHISMKILLRIHNQANPEVVPLYCAPVIPTERLATTSAIVCDFINFQKSRNMTRWIGDEMYKF